VLHADHHVVAKGRPAPDVPVPHRRSPADRPCHPGDDLRVVADAIRLARATFTTIRRNLAWAFGYNLIALRFAALGYLNPVIASAAMTLSSAFVVASSLRLTRFRALTPHDRAAFRR
jgi:hypothetical protein